MVLGMMKRKMGQMGFNSLLQDCIDGGGNADDCKKTILSIATTGPKTGAGRRRKKRSSKKRRTKKHRSKMHRSKRHRTKKHRTKKHRSKKHRTKRRR